MLLERRCTSSVVAVNAIRRPIHDHQNSARKEGDADTDTRNVRSENVLYSKFCNQISFQGVPKTGRKRWGLKIESVWAEQQLAKLQVELAGRFTPVQALQAEHEARPPFGVRDQTISYN
jgi:hypothetical protein